MVAGLLLSSCASYHLGYVTDSVSLSSDNFSYVERDVTGESTAKYWFLLGNWNKESLVQAAKRDLISQYNLEDNQTLANITVEYRHTHKFFIYVERTCMVNADIVEFTD